MPLFSRFASASGGSLHRRVLFCKYLIPSPLSAETVYPKMVHYEIHPSRTDTFMGGRSVVVGSKHGTNLITLLLNPEVHRFCG